MPVPSERMLKLLLIRPSTKPSTDADNNMTVL